LFAEQVQKTPNKTAVVCDNRALTYRELDHMSNNLASVLNINVGDVVALHMHRSEMIMVAQLTVLKAGGIFLPIDLSVPTDRMRDMLQDCQAK
jgi:surfactin family lipopeptide synthetase B/lichenysin synthetase B